MANYQQAPELAHLGVKKLPEEKQTYQIPQLLGDIIFNELGNSSAQLRIMLVLIGTKPGFKISEQWILDRTGLKHASYITARKALIDRGWLALDAAKAITVNFNNIYGKENRGNTILPQCSNTILPQRGNTILPIIDKEIDNKIDNISDAFSASAEKSSTEEVQKEEIAPEAPELRTVSLNEVRQYWSKEEYKIAENGILSFLEGTPNFGRKYRVKDYKEGA